MKGQTWYDNLLPEDPPAPHRYTGEVSGKGYVFTLEDGEFISVFDGEDTTLFWDWAGPNAAVEAADEEAERLYKQEIEDARF
jgi:hypothetical protein